jgi:DNA-binding IclR family transcriptional regulator
VALTGAEPSLAGRKWWTPHPFSARNVFSCTTSVNLITGDRLRRRGVPATQDSPLTDPGGVDACLPTSILSKTFDVLSSFGPDRRVLTLTEIARASGLPKSTVHRLINRLVPLGMIEAHRHGYKLGLSMRRFAAAMPIEALRQSALPHLAKLHHWANRHVHLAQLRGSEVVFIERFMLRDDALPSVSPGAVLPAHATALGKAMLAHITPDELDDALGRPLEAITASTVIDVDSLSHELGAVRADGTALARGEAHPEVTCLAAPIVGRARPIGAVSVSLRNDGRAIDRALADALVVTAKRIARDTLSPVADGHDIWFPGGD